MALTPEEIAAQAAALNFNGGIGYIGSDEQDDMLSFSGDTRSLISRPNSLRQYKFEVRNASDGNRVIALCAGVFTDTTELSNYLGFAVDRIITATGTASSITVTPNDTRISPSFLMSHIRFNNTQLIQMTIGANDVKAWRNASLEVYRCEPWNIAQRVGPAFSLNTVFDQYQQQSNKVDFLIDDYLPGAQFDDQTIIVLRLGGRNIIPDSSVGAGDGGLTLDFTLDFGGSISTAVALRKKVARAKQTVAMSAMAVNHASNVRPFSRRR